MTGLIENIYNPGVWVLGALLAWSVAQTAGALMARRHYREINRLADEILSDPSANDGDRVWVASALRSSLEWAPVVVASIAAPLLPIVSIIAVFSSMVREEVFVTDDTFDEMQTRIDGLTRLLALDQGQADPTTGAFWADPRRKVMERHAQSTEYWLFPLLTVWLGIWALLSLPLMLATGAARPTANLLSNSIATLIRKISSALNVLRFA